MEKTLQTKCQDCIYCFLCRVLSNNLNWKKDHIFCDMFKEDVIKDGR